VLIVSADHQPIRQALLTEIALLTEMGRGVTTPVGKGGYTEHERQVLFCVVTRLEITRVETLVKSKDPSAFFVVLQVHEASGVRIKRRAFP
jgi:uncharacterized membrane-anchored protein YitT (DUF2179 family)